MQFFQFCNHPTCCAILSSFVITLLVVPYFLVMESPYLLCSTFYFVIAILVAHFVSSFVIILLVVRYFLVCNHPTCTVLSGYVITLIVVQYVLVL